MFHKCLSFFEKMGHGAKLRGQKLSLKMSRVFLTWYSSWLNFLAKLKLCCCRSQPCCDVCLVRLPSCVALQSFSAKMDSVRVCNSRSMQHRPIDAQFRNLFCGLHCSFVSVFSLPKPASRLGVAPRQFQHGRHKHVQTRTTNRLIKTTYYKFVCFPLLRESTWK